jgi:hypothetical protein
MAAVLLLYFSLFAGQLGLAANTGFGFVILIGLLALLLVVLAVMEVRRLAATTALIVHELGLELPVPRSVAMRPFTFVKALPFTEISWMTRTPIGWEIAASSGTFYIPAPISVEDEERLQAVAGEINKRDRSSRAVHGTS